MSITQQAFEAAQASEIQNWIKDTGNDGRILYELSEHSTPAGPIRRLSEGRRFERGLDVGVGCFGLGFIGVHLPDIVGAIDGLDPLPRLELQLRDPALQRYVDSIRSRVHYLRAAAEEIPMADESYDLAACINVVDHAQDPPRILGEINRVLKPGGLLAFGVSTLSSVGEMKWRMKRRARPNDWHFLAHPHTYQWRAADRLVRGVPGKVLWQTSVSFINGILGHGRMSFWIVRKDS